MVSTAESGNFKKTNETGLLQEAFYSGVYMKGNKACGFELPQTAGRGGN